MNSIGSARADPILTVNISLASTPDRIVFIIGRHCPAGTDYSEPPVASDSSRRLRLAFIRLRSHPHPNRFKW
jgi:hypothetical protein